ncbi:hypothetical protein [Halorubrum sp. GN11GM_10-3_MGM]|uniref:hypothetical protein n=1 Tax=Halorubrum sp. GN11GM_10-3_MGM TaxID=2518111 RepID=UPI0013051953|nr:hypothetical protein [Halorubrum sp. GN11GM_10-3_MGM]
MTPSKDSPRAPTGESTASDEKAPERRPAPHFDARDVLAGRTDAATVRQAVENRR